MNTYTPVTLITGRDYCGNEYAYTKSSGSPSGWIDIYNACPITRRYIANEIIPHVTHVRFGDEIMSRDAWVASGTPFELDEAQMDALRKLNAPEPETKPIIRTDSLVRKLSVMDEPGIAELIAAAYMDGEGAYGLVSKVIVGKSFAERWTNNPDHYKSHYGADEMEVKG